MTDGDKLREIADALDVIDERAGTYGGQMQQDLRRIALDVDRPEPLEWLVIGDRSVRLPDVESIQVHFPTDDGTPSLQSLASLDMGMVSGSTFRVHVEPEDVEELLEEIHRSRS